MDDTRWLRWLQEVTGEESERGIAKAAGVSHTTVGRWIAKGVPAQAVWELTLRFRGNPIAALIVLGRVSEQQVPYLNFEPVLHYAPEEVITGELHRRAMERRHTATRPPGVPLGRSDSLVRQPMRLTTKR